MARNQEKRRIYMREYSRKWRSANKEKSREYSKLWRSKNTARVLLIAAEHRAAPEYRRWLANYRKANANKISDQRKARRQRNKAREAATNRAWRLANPRKCKVYARRSYFKRQYGITLEEKDVMIAAQGGLCAICRIDVPSARGVWSVDHCHSTGRLRGILCNKCNLMIGLAGDSIFVLAAAQKYLKQHGAAS